MDNYGYNIDEREPVRAYTPSHTSDEDQPGRSNQSFNERTHRLFSFKKEGRSWVNAICAESGLGESEIRKRAKQPRKATHSVDHQLEKMSPPRRQAIEELLDRTNRKDPNGYEWDILAIDNDRPDLTKRTGDVASFSVILARITGPRQGSKPISRERRRSTYRAPEEDYDMPVRREARPYNRVNDSPNRDNKNSRQTQNYSHSQSIQEEDPFGTTALFSGNGEPVGPSGNARCSNTGLPPHITPDEPIGAPVKKEKAKKNKSNKAENVNDFFDIDTLLGDCNLGSGEADVLIDDFDEHNDHDDFNPIEIISDHKEKPRGRKQAEKGWKAKPNDADSAWSRPKSKSKPRRLSVSIPKGDYDRRPAPVEILPAGRRKAQPYYSSRYSGTTGSIHSDIEVLEAEYEDYSSSPSSEGREGDWRRNNVASTYTPGGDRYGRATNYHRRGPPSPHQVRYENFGYDQATYTQRRPSRSERHLSDTAVQRYSFTPTSAQRPPIISQVSVPRFTPTLTSAHPASAAVAGYSGYSYDNAMTPFPSDLRRRDSVQAQHAELYMRTEQHKDREIELLQRERDVAMREAELHQEVARRVSVSGRPSQKYTHEPRMSRRYPSYNT